MPVLFLISSANIEPVLQSLKSHKALTQTAFNFQIIFHQGNFLTVRSKNKEKNLRQTELSKIDLRRRFKQPQGKVK